jgi:adenine phosphoribosyltransferase
MGYNIGHDRIRRSRAIGGFGVSLKNLLDLNLSDEKLVDIVESQKHGTGLDNMIAAVYGAYQKQTNEVGISNLDKLIRETDFKSNFSEHYDHFMKMGLGLDAAEAFALAYVTHKTESMLRKIKDYPVPEVLYRDIGPVLVENNMLGLIAESMAFILDKAGIEYDVIAAPASRGYLVGGALSTLKRRGIIRITKAKDKSLPPPTRQYTVTTYRGHPETFEIQNLKKYSGKKVVIVDDIIGSGGTDYATRRLLEQVGAIPLQSIYLLGIQKENYTTNEDIPKPFVLLPLK